MEKQPRNLILRADASAEMGTGHVMRCLALAQGWKAAGGQAVFFQAKSTAAIRERLLAEEMIAETVAAQAGDERDATATIDLARTHDAGWVVADGYDFSSTWQRKVKEAGVSLLLFDDFGHADHYHCDLVLNQNLDADERLYLARDPSTDLLLGTQYALLRREFTSWAKGSREIGAAGNRILVSLGGSDPGNVTAKVIQALATLPAVEAIVVVGGSNPHLERLQAMVQPQAAAQIRIVTNITNMPEAMAWADLAVAAAGSTSWELAFMGLPAVVVTLAENQHPIARALAAHGISRSLGWHADVTADRLRNAIVELLGEAGARREMSAQAQRLVDGLGVERVVRRIREGRPSASSAGRFSAN